MAPEATDPAVATRLTTWPTSARPDSSPASPLRDGTKPSRARVRSARRATSPGGGRAPAGGSMEALAEEADDEAPPDLPVEAWPFDHSSPGRCLAAGPGREPGKLERHRDVEIQAGGLGRGVPAGGARRGGGADRDPAPLDRVPGRARRRGAGLRLELRLRRAGPVLPHRRGPARNPPLLLRDPGIRLRAGRGGSRRVSRPRARHPSPVSRRPRSRGDQVAGPARGLLRGDPPPVPARRHRR